MWVSKLALHDFRSYEHLELDLRPGVTTFVAPNGWGKTNLVEALGYVSTLRSHRVANDVPLVRVGCESGVVSLLAHRGPRSVTLDITIKAKGANRARINRQPVRTRDVLGLLPTVVFAPEDLDLVKGDPAGRRDFLDTLLVQGAPRYAAVLSDFDRALKQRNALLKSLKNRPDPALESTLDIWDRAFAQAAAQLVMGRRNLVERLAAPLTRDFKAVALDARPERQDAAARYTSRIDYTGLDTTAGYEDAIVEAVASRRSKEIDRGLTLVGPQRDDVELLIGGVPAKGYASHGESWSLALALRLAGWQVLRDDAGDEDGQPVLVLDDVFAELDAGRRTRLAQMVAGAQQVLITAAVAADIPENLAGARIDLSAADAGTA
ncbi:DNA replication/repair protein RecF [Brevibacterium sp. 50QC2O2]|uniref:DNA replication/repair protein RecF n=1 Tax=Brevibacterium TaxID=1696 RepID=UPI00211BAB70|nr:MULTISPECIES: DNA replication/repair protein RecF [unclassified Brevibacterium]MCQ9368677.1 DNA replication/repair protein RecF [Brevibacterium sp. 91QC2O2]MCQ9386430.1 DNA replication/repair protein RecF [Brevibacterium sp. 68QC2CO]MCQ9389510.1 DNA replication/repair protein RecF [Brevibacterium sp. 50QC2O2]